MSREKRKDRAPPAGEDPSRSPASLAEGPLEGRTPPAEGAVRGRVLPVLAVFAIQALFLGIIFIVALSGSPPPRIRGMDAVTVPGGAAPLRVIVEREDPPFPGLDTMEGKPVLFERLSDDAAGSKAPLGSAEIDATGLAELPISAPGEPGLHRFGWRVEGAPELAEREGDILVASVPPGKGLLLVILPGTPDESRFFGKVAGDDMGAPAALGSLAADRSIVYLVRRYPPGGRAWIAAQGLPRGPVISFGEENGGLRRLLASLGLDRWKGRNAALATSREDAAALSLAGARVVLLGGGESMEGPFRPAGRWSEAARILKEPG